MGTQSVVHGRILLQRENSYKKAKKTIEKISKNSKGFDFLNNEMFSLLSHNVPNHYDQPVIGFARTYKGIEYDWTSFIMVFENLLRQIDFDNVKLQLETEFLGTYNFFWQSKNIKTEYKETEELIETKEWFFGQGCRGRWGLVNHTSADEKDGFLYGNGFRYPLEFDLKTLEKVNQIIEKIKLKPLNVKYEIEKLTRKGFDNYDKLFEILVYLELNDEIEFGAESGKGYWLSKLKEIKPIISAMPR